jgi:hypothetical protein
MSKEALKLALEALEGADMIDCDMRDAIISIKEALAKFCDANCVWTDHHPDCNLAQSEQDTIYRLSALVRAQQITIDKLEAQPEQEPEEQRLLRRKWLGHRDTDHLSFTEAVDATMEKLYAELKPKQEPVAYCYVQKGTSVDILTFDDEPIDAIKGTLFPLYTTPPQRKPLTDEEISEIAINNPPMVHEFARAIEAAHGIEG